MFIWIDRSWGCHRMWPSPASRTARYVPQVPDCGCEQKADLVTIGGDLWEDEHVTPDTRRFVASELKDLSLPVLMICGNHDPYLAGGNYARSVWPDNVRICQRDQLTEFQFGPVSVWAVSWLGGRRKCKAGTKVGPAPKSPSRKARRLLTPPVADKK